MKISREDVAYIAKLAKLRFSDEELDRLTREFETILTHFHSIDRMDLENVDLDKVPVDQQSVVRSDEKTVFEDKKKLFNNAKSMRETYIQVPKIIE
ncbi:MAG: Asp-tRNA(Asn)/Glu-tRNA(Gln) amidotransferase subunit GatC [Clostridiaceae bacterium]|jgi:aspartyl-tRNA(Asn)/glutamyl-tRNA(Gln) amidotransferase subunit C|nr:Asp-tRNA(Asn)/Glu-tRNA(Gln) amidotransferase subunit GatC [Clostridiaceae bacterium]